MLADQLGRSVGDMYKGAIGPSIVQVLLFLAYRWMVRPQVDPDPNAPATTPPREGVTA